MNPPAIPAFDAVVWDYDGTLVDTRSADEAAVAALLAADPAAAQGVPDFWASEGRPIRERVELAWPGRAPEVLAHFDRGIVPRVFPGVRRALAQLRRRGIRLAVVSSRRLEPLHRGLDACRLSGAFTAVVGLESVSAPKPDPEGLLLALAALAVPPGRAVYVGDRLIDMEAARRSGTTGWLATWGHRPEDARGAAVLLDLPVEVVHRLDGRDAAAG